MKRLLFALSCCFLFAFSTRAQQVTYSDYERQDGRDMNFEVIGKMNGNYLVYKNMSWRHKISVFDGDMKTKEIIDLDFVPDKTFNIDFITYPDFFYMIYQYQKRSIVYCMGVKMGADGKKLSEPVQLDTTQIALMADNKIYSTISSEDKQKIMVFKVHKKSDRYNVVTILLDKQLQLIRKSREIVPFNERRDNFGDFLLDNDGHLVFSISTQASGVRDNANVLQLITKSPLQDTFSWHKIDLQEKYIDEVKLKIDNLNRQYLVNSFYYKKNRGSIEGLFTLSWDKDKSRPTKSTLTPLYDSLRDLAKKEGSLKFAFDDFFIRNIIVKKDGGFVLAAEDFSSQSRGFNNSWNRWDYLNNPYFYNSNYYYYNPYGGFYRPMSRFNNNQSTRYYYANVVILSFDKNGQLQWSNLIQKDQFDDDDDNFMSYFIMNSGGELHFIYNGDSKYQVIADHSISPDGTLKRNPTLKSREKGYQFMPKLAKQVGARQLIVPCSYRGFICFAKVDF